MKLGPDIARLAALIGDPARANMLTALMSGCALTSSELALEAGVTAATASSHLAKLSEAELIHPTAQGRHRYWRLADADVAAVLESLMGLAARTGHNRVRPGPKEPALRKARICYDHLAGDYGVRLYQCLLEKGVITQSKDDLALGPAAPRFTEDLSLDLGSSKRSPCRACLDWSVRRHHLAGSLGAAILNRILALGWAHRDPNSRALHFTADGERQFLLVTRPREASLSENAPEASQLDGRAAPATP